MGLPPACPRRACAARRAQRCAPHPTPPHPDPLQCTGANPRYPRIAELRQLLIDAWERPIAETLTTEPGLGATAVPLT